MNLKANVVALFGLCALIALAGCDQKAKEAQEHRKKGNEAFKKDQWAPAIEAFDKSLAVDPAQEKLWQKKAIAHTKLNQSDQAVQAMLKTLEFKTDAAGKAEVYRNMANMFYQGGAVDKAEQYFLEALKEDPKDEASLSWLGEIFSRLGGARAAAAPAVPEHLDKALKYYDQAIAVNPGAVNNYFNKRIAYSKYLEYLKQAKDAADKEAVENPKDPVKLADAQARATAHQTKMDELRTAFMENDKKLAEASKAQQAAAKK